MLGPTCMGSRPAAASPPASQPVLLLPMVPCAGTCTYQHCCGTTGKRHPVWLTSVFITTPIRTIGTVCNGVTLLATTPHVQAAPYCSIRMCLPTTQWQSMFAWAHSGLNLYLLLRDAFKVTLCLSLSTAVLASTLQTQSVRHLPHG